MERLYKLSNFHYKFYYHYSGPPEEVGQGGRQPVLPPPQIFLSMCSFF